MMIIEKFPAGPFETNAYVVACPETKTAVIIDPAPGSASLIIDFLSQNQLLPEKILLTHSHWDHIGDVSHLQTHYNIPVFVHAADAKNLENPGSDGLPYWGEIQGATPSEFLNEGDTIPFGNLCFTVFHTPGHTPGGVCFYEKKQGVLFSGDTFFKGAIGNLSLPTAQSSAMWESLKKLATLPPETRVYPGHGQETTIEKEKWLANAEKIFGKE